MGYFYLNVKYISENVCVNRFDALPVCKGKCFLKKKLNEQEQREQKLPDFKQKEIQLFYQKSLFSLFTKASEHQDLFNFPTQSLNLQSTILDSVFHPPQVA